MKDPKRYEVNGKVYVTIPLGGRDAIKLDKMVSPLLFRLGQRSAKVKMDEMAIVLSEIFSEMEDSRFEAIRALTFKNTTYAGNDNEKSISLAGEVCYDHFQGRLLDMYSAMVQTWEVHELTPFQMMAGSLTEETA